jgi:hypothetical protein
MDRSVFVVYAWRLLSEADGRCVTKSETRRPRIALVGILRETSTVGATEFCSHNRTTPKCESLRSRGQRVGVPAVAAIQ